MSFLPWLNKVLSSCCKTERFSKVETRNDSKKRARDSSRLWEKLDFYIVPVGARDKYRRPYSFSCTTTPRLIPLHFLNFLRLSLPHGFVRETRQFKLATDIFIQRSICSIYVHRQRVYVFIDYGNHGSLAFRIFRPHGLQTRSDSSEVERTSIPKWTEHNSAYLGQGFAIVVIVS